MAVITGAASGIGLATALRLAEQGLKVVLADLAGDNLDHAAADVAHAAPGGGDDVMAHPTDVSKPGDLEILRDAVIERFGPVSVLMNNAAVSTNPGGAWKGPDDWRRLFEVNLWGVINGVQTFAPAMVASQTPGLIINTGSKQGITNPPGNTAYNVAKAAVKTYTEALSYELCNTPRSAVSAHLLIPGFTFTGMTSSRHPEKPPGAWTAEQVVNCMLKALDDGDFYILCPDNDVDSQTDHRRILWAAGDLVENRPALSRWRPDHKDAFERFMAGES